MCCWGQGWRTDTANSRRNRADDSTEQITRLSIPLLLLSRQSLLSGPQWVIKADEGGYTADGISLGWKLPGNVPGVCDNLTGEITCQERFTLEQASRTGKGCGVEETLYSQGSFGCSNN